MPKMDAQKCMEDFIKYKEKLDNIKSEENDCDESYENQYMKLRDITLSFRTDGTYSSSEGEKKCNSFKNRYKDIVPYDHTRVRLKDVCSGTDYINASFIKGMSGEVTYIAAQGPLPETVADFWKMLWDNNIKVVIMLCNEYEGIPRKLRCQRYWANDASECLEIGDFSVALAKEDETNYPNEYTLRHLHVTHGSETRELIHLHYKVWPDKYVPKCIPSVLAIIEQMRKIQPADVADAPPVVVHCSAGCGRTGTILVLDYVLNLLKFGKLQKNFSLYEIILEMRTQRMAIVQTLEQYEYVHDAVAEMFKREMQQMTSNGNNNAVKSVKLPPVPPVKQRAGNSYEELSSSRKPSVTRSDNQESSSRPLPPRKPSADKLAPPKSLGFLSSSTEYSDLSPADSISSPASDVFDPFVSGANKKLPSPPSVPMLTGSSAQSSHLYAEVDFGSSEDSSNKVNGAYTYANPEALGKWSLQDVARNKPDDSSNYATVSDGTYSEIQCFGNNSSLEIVPGKRPSDARSDDESAPPVPGKNFLTTSLTSETNPQPAPARSASASKLNIIKTMLKGSDPIPSAGSSSFPAKVMFHNMDISFPNRAGRPRYGERPLKMLVIPSVM